MTNNTETYRVWLTNFGYFLLDSFMSLDAARDAARRAGFEATIYKGADIAGAWSMFSGYRRIR